MLTVRGFGCAGARETVRFLPPLTVSEAEIDKALHIFEECLSDVFGSSSASTASQKMAA